MLCPLEDVHRLALEYLLRLLESPLLGLSLFPMKASHGTLVLLKLPPVALPFLAYLFPPFLLLLLDALPLAAQDGIVLVDPARPSLVVAIDLLLVYVDIALPQTTGPILLILKRPFHFSPIPAFPFNSLSSSGASASLSSLLLTPWPFTLSPPAPESAKPPNDRA
jgi:hypothetical protein